MKKLSLIFILCIVFLMGCTKGSEPKDNLSIIKENKVIKIGVKDDSKPFGFVKNGTLQGFDIDIAKSIAEELFLSNDYEAHIKFIPLNPWERISALNTDKVDIVIATLSINEARKELIDFSIPYYTAGQALMVKNGSKITSVPQLNNKKTVAVVLGTTGEKTIRMLAPNATSIGSTNYKEAFEHLKSGLADAILADDSLLYGIAQDNRGYKVLSGRYTTEYYAIGLKKDPANEGLKKQIDLIIQEMQQSGKLNKIKRKWIPANNIN